MIEALPASYASTRDALHALAEQVVAPARYQAERHIGLAPTPGGFGTPMFGDGERVRVDGVELVHERPGTSTRIGITTLTAAAQFVDVPLGVPADVYTSVIDYPPDAPLAVRVDGARALATWYEFAATVLDELRATYAAHEPSGSTIWPEHFDLACELGSAGAGTRANYGASPGDGGIDQPYLYVGPWDAGRRIGALAAYPFGAAITYDELLASGDARGRALEFCFEGAALLVGAP